VRRKWKVQEFRPHQKSISASFDDVDTIDKEGEAKGIDESVTRQVSFVLFARKNGRGEGKFSPLFRVNSNGENLDESEKK